MKHNKNMKTKNILKKLIFIIPFVILIIMSLLLMYHAKFIMNTYKNHFTKQIIWFIIGFFIIGISSLVSFKKIFSSSFILYLMNIFLLVIVLFIGKDVNGAKAWIDLKYFNLQPSELMKLTYSLFLARFVAQKKIKTWLDEFLFLIQIGFIFLVPSILIFLEPDTGAILFLGIITLVILWNSSLRKRWFIFLGTIIIILIALFFYCYFYQKDFLISIIGTSFFYRMDRLLDFRSGMQIEHAMIAIGSAPLIRFSLFETGIYIPESPTDFIFALSSNVFGIIGNITIIICYFILDMYLLQITKKIKAKEEQLFTKAFIAIFITSQIINISMNLGIFPIIGIPLPFLSYGGSSTIVLFIFLSIIYNTTKKKKTSNKK